MDILEKIRQARQKTVKVGGYTFVVKRPTDFQMLQQPELQGDFLQSDLLKQFVIGWENVTEADLIPDGSDTVIEFSSEVFMAWVEDQPQLWGPLIDQVTQLYAAHLSQRSENEKKLASG